MDALESWRCVVATNPTDHENTPEIPEGPREKLDRIGPNVLPEHRAILEAALAQSPMPPLFEVLASMPDVGEDSDFARSRG